MVFTERKVNQDAVNQLWELLVQNNVLTLPTQNSLENKFVKYVVDTADLQSGRHRKIVTVDGILYGFELLTPNRRRYYSYGNPKVYLDNYGNVKELFNAVSIIMIIQKFLGHRLEVN